MPFLETTHPSKLSKYIRTIFRKINIDIDEPLSTLSSLFSFAGIFLIISFYSKMFCNFDTSLVFLLFAHMSNQIGSTMMHATECSCFHHSDGYTMHIGLMFRVFDLSRKVLPSFSPLWYLILAGCCNIFFVNVESGIATLASSLFLLQILHTPHKFVSLRITFGMLLLGLLFQFLSRPTKSKKLQMLNKYLESHMFWHLTITAVFVFYSYSVSNPTFDNYNYYPHLYIDASIYGLFLLLSYTFGLYKYLQKCIYKLKFKNILPKN